MQTDPKVSVMIITYNQAHFIRETLDSVLSQDYDNLEIIVADDASTDETPAILQAYAAAHPTRIFPMLNERNLGITGNCNVALNACTGELIAMLGGDDLFLPGKIRQQINAFVADPQVVLSYHPVEIFDSASNKTLTVTNQTAREDTNSAEEMITRGGIPGASSVMVRRSASIIGFDPRLPTVSDWLFYIEVALNGKVVKLDGVYGRYRKHGSGISNRSLELLDESLRTLDLVVEKHPERPDLVGYCQRGKARYIAGEGFRQLSKNPALAHQLFTQALELDPQNYKLRLSYLLSKSAPISIYSGKLAARFKYTLKRYTA